MAEQRDRMAQQMSEPGGLLAAIGQYALFIGIFLTLAFGSILTLSLARNRSNFNTLPFHKIFEDWTARATFILVSVVLMLFTLIPSALASRFRGYVRRRRSNNSGNVDSSPGLRAL
jgi:hypothetical protein